MKNQTPHLPVRAFVAERDSTCRENSKQKQQSSAEQQKRKLWLNGIPERPGPVFLKK